jgi:hypothetical protein
VYVLQVYSEQIAKNFGLIHSLEIPVSKEPTWIGETMRYKGFFLHIVYIQKAITVFTYAFDYEHFSKP